MEPKYNTLADYYYDTRTTRSMLAKRVGCTRQHLHAIERGESFAGPGLALAIVNATGVRVQSVVSPDLALLLHRMAS